MYSAKNYHDAEHAHLKVHETIPSSRSGLCVSEDEISRLNKIISPLIQNGQSVSQIYINHADDLICSGKTIYNYSQKNNYERAVSGFSVTRLYFSFAKAAFRLQKSISAFYQ